MWGLGGSSMEYVENVSVRANVSLPCHTSLQPRQHRHHRQHRQHRQHRHHQHLVDQESYLTVFSHQYEDHRQQMQRGADVAHLDANDALHICIYAMHLGGSLPLLRRVAGRFVQRKTQRVCLDAPLDACTACN